MLCSALLASCGWIFSREAIQGFEPQLFMCLRFLGAGIIVWLVDFSALFRLNLQQWLITLRVGILFGIAMSLWVVGLKMATHIGIAAFITNLGMILVPIFALFFGERPNIWVYLSLPLAIAGLACLSLDAEFSLGLPELLFFISAAVNALMIVLNTKATARVPLVPLTAIQLMITGIFTGILSAGFETWNFHQPITIWAWLLASLLLATGLRYLIQVRAQSMAPPHHTALIMLTQPITALLFAAIWFSETMSVMQFLGCFLIFSAMLASRAQPLFKMIRQHKPRQR